MQKNLVWIVAAVAIVGAAIYVLATNRPGTQHSPALDALAACLKEKGAVFYGSFWCSHCQDQKQAFGASAKLLPYVECSTADSRGQTAICVEKGVKNYPTWIFVDGSRETGKLEPDHLAEKAGCVVPQ